VGLEDDWRRSLKISSGDVVQSAGDAGANQGEITQQAQENTIPIDPIEAEFNLINSQIPRTEDQVETALTKIEDAYFRLGDIYYFNLEEKDNAEKAFKQLLERFPESEYAAEVLYKLYLINKDSNEALAAQYAKLLISNYPESTYARILINPEYLRESSQTIEKQKSIYKISYDYYEKENYVDAMQSVQEGLAMGQTAFYNNLELLRILIIGQTESIKIYQDDLRTLIEKNPDEEILNYAKKLLETSQSFEKYEETKMSMHYSYEIEGIHYFVITYKSADKISDVASRVLETFSQNYFKASNLKTSNLALNDEYGLTIVSELSDATSAYRYYQTFIEKLPSLTDLHNHNFNRFVISTGNFNIFYRTKGLNEYLQFFEKNYKTITP
jgi:tetratricopeptide (TPR) repeat protein